MVQMTIASMANLATGIDPLVNLAVMGILFVILVEVVYALGGLIGVLSDDSPFRRKL